MTLLLLMCYFRLATYTNYPSTYTGGYGVGGYRGGWYGTYNPALLYWAIIPSAFYIGYWGAYHRYNSQTGAYYAPVLSTGGEGTSNVIINGTEYTSDDDNYHYTFNMSTNNVYPMADYSFFASSDPSANPADFAYRLLFANVIEFNDANNNGFYDNGEQVLAVTSLANLPWQPLAVANRTAPNNASQTFIEVTTMASNVTRNNNASDTSFTAYLTWRSSNLQINATDGGVPLQPNSLWYNLSLSGYPLPTSPSTRLAIAQVLSLSTDNNIVFDVNMTTPADVARQIKTNETYGLSLGNYSNGRLEYEPTVNITDVSQPPSNAGIPSDSNRNAWIWGNSFDSRQQKLLYISIPYQNSTSPKLTGFGFLDVDVMNAAASGADTPSNPIANIATSMSAKVTLALATTAGFFMLL